MGIRDIVLLAILAASVPLSFLRPFFGLLVFSWLAYMRPNDMTWGVNAYRPSLIIGVATVLGLLWNRRERMVVLEKRTVLIGVFLACVTVSTLLAPNPWDSVVKGNLADLGKILFIALLTTGLVSTRDRARWLLLVIAMSLGALAVKSAIQGAIHPGTVMHGPGGAIEDNNDYGLALVMTVPLLAYLARDEKGPFLKALLVGMSIACVAGVLFTRSRGGVLALALMGIFWMFKLRRNAWALTIAPLALALTIVVSPPELWERVRNLTTGANDASAHGRLVAWEKGINMWNAHPMFGVGPGNFTDPVIWANTASSDQSVTPKVAHNTYIQILAESGIVTLLVFITMLLVTLWTLARTKVDAKDPWRARYADGVFLSLIGFMAGSFFLSRTHFDLTYHLIGFSVALRVAAQGEAFDWFGLRKFLSRKGGESRMNAEGRGA